MPDGSHMVCARTLPLRPSDNAEPSTDHTPLGGFSFARENEIAASPTDPEGENAKGRRRSVSGVAGTPYPKLFSSNPRAKQNRRRRGQRRLEQPAAPQNQPAQTHAL